MKPPDSQEQLSIMLEDEIPTPEQQSFTQQLKRSSDIKRDILSLDQITRLVMSSPNISMIVLIIFSKLLLLQTSSKPYFILKMLESDG